jgi:DNA-directed RNA polymerase specialized sigma24 family protein
VEPLDKPALWLADPRNRPDRASAELDAHAELSRLPGDQQQAIVLHWIYGFSFEEIALKVGASVGAVKVRAHRGYEAMRRAFVM